MWDGEKLRPQQISAAPEMDLIPVTASDSETIWLFIVHTREEASRCTEDTEKKADTD